MTTTSGMISRRLVRVSPYEVRVGIRCMAVADDSATFELPFDPGNTNPYGFVHGGASSSLADCTVTAAAWSRIEPPHRCRGLTVGLSLACGNVARGDDVTATATLLRLTGRRA